jgi:CheY-like chemotaxis protein
MKVLIAEDELVTRTVMARAVAHAGHEVATVPDGREMLRMFVDMNPEVLLVDWQMPVLSGVEAIRELRALPGGHQAFVILVTGVNGDAETAQALDAGIDDYMLKPISAPRLRVVLQLAEARIHHRKQSKFRPLGSADLTLEEIMSGFGPVLALSPTGRVTFASGGWPNVDATKWVGRPIEALFDSHGVDILAILRASASQGEVLAVSGSFRGAESIGFSVRPVYRRQVLAGFILGESTRLASALPLAKVVNE